MSTIPRFLSSISKWPSSPALNDLWLVTLDLNSIPALRVKNDFVKALNVYEGNLGGGWGVSPQTLQSLLKPEIQGNGANALTGCIFARSVTIPGESMGINYNGLNYGSYMGAYTSSNRSANFRKIDMSLLETHNSFTDLVIRPWLVMVGYYGLVARGNDSSKNIKCPSIKIYQLGKSGPASSNNSNYTPASQPVVRQTFSFYNVVPSYIDSLTHNYSDGGLKQRSVSFSCDYYKIDAKTSF